MVNAVLQKLSQLFNQGRRVVYQKDDVIIRPGDTPSGLYYIVSGWVKAYSLCKNGEPNIIMTLCPGEVFPIAWAVSGSTRDVGFGALGNTEVQRISLEQFLQAAKTDVAIMQEAVEALAHHFFVLATELDNLQYRSAREKVVFRLIFLANRLGQQGGTNDDRVVIKTRITNDYIARSTSITRETASRELSRLNRRQLIRNVEGLLIIPSLSSLRNEISRNFNFKTLSLD
jgi:CRP/FNR family transcriptional regulator, cyclic AMP receptor protein